MKETCPAFSFLWPGHLLCTMVNRWAHVLLLHLQDAERLKDGSKRSNELGGGGKVEAQPGGLRLADRFMENAGPEHGENQ